MDTRKRLQNAGKKINGGYSKWVALRKLVVSEKRDWRQTPAPRIGWKRGELFEVAAALFTGNFAEEWGDVGYYAAQSFDIVWWLYCIVTPGHIIRKAVKKFEKRANAHGKQNAACP